MGAGDDARPKGPKLEARRAESGGGVLGEGAASPLPTSQGVWGSAVSSPSRVRGGAPSAKGFWRISALPGGAPKT